MLNFASDGGPSTTCGTSQLVANRIQLVAIDSSHAEKVATMPLHHRDPFDRLIVAQTLIEQMTVVSVDSAFDDYGVSRLW